jgi:hypothetical protein
MNNSAKWGSEQDTDRNMDNDWKLVNSEEEIKMDNQAVPKQKRNIGTPLIVDAFSDDINVLNIPQTFEQKTKSSMNIFYPNDTLGLNALPNEKNMRVTIAKSIKPKHRDTYVTHQKQSSPVRTAMSSAMSSNMMSPNKSLNRDNGTKPRNSSRQRNVNTQQRVTVRKPQVYCIRNIVIVIMESKSRFCFTGKLLVKVLFGAVEIYGFTLNRSTNATEVYSPRGYSNVSIETSTTCAEGSIEDVWTSLASKGITRDSESRLQIDIDNVQPGTAILVLQNFENNLTRFLKTHFPSFRLFPNINNPCYYSWVDPRRAEIVLQANLHLGQYDDPNYRRLITDSCITIDIVEKMLSSWRANEWSCTLIAGGKSVGKSTSVRYLINSLLRTSNKVVLVDVDPGQTECTPAGCISYSLIEEPLMGPNFTHLRMPVYQLFLDSINVAECVPRYLEGVKTLIERLKACPILSRLPIVVNTMGFTMNLGWDIAMFTIKLIRPTIILQIMSRKKKNYRDYLSAQVVNNQVICNFFDNKYPLCLNICL